MTDDREARKKKVREWVAFLSVCAYTHLIGRMFAGSGLSLWVIIPLELAFAAFFYFLLRMMTRDV